MLDQSLSDTIIAVSTPPGYGGIGIIRLSGKDALKIAKKIFKPRKSWKKALPMQATFGNLFDFGKKTAFDEAFMINFPAPHSYTRENVVEISGHGSPAVMEEALRLGIRAGARHARPGEFTLRAYLRGRVDIVQAEAVNDLIRAASVQTAKMAFSQLDGKLSRKIVDFRFRVIEVLSRVEASIEFPDEKLGITPKQISGSLERMIVFLDELVSSYETGKALLEGVTLAITGRTNVGKSTLFNAILEEDRAIVTPYPGTTRDYLKERIKINDVYFNLVDMAGFGKAASSIEKEGMKRGKRIASQAEGIILLLDTSRKEDPDDITLLKRFRDKKMLLVFNKIDLPSKMDIPKIKNRFAAFPSLEVSALRGTNLKRLKHIIYDIFSPKPEKHEDVIFHLRQKLVLEESLRHLKRALRLFKEGHPEEVCAEEVRKVIPIIGQLTGEILADDVIKHIFSRFCVGK